MTETKIQTNPDETTQEETPQAPQPALKMANKDDIFDLLKHDPKDDVVEKEIDINGEKRVFYIKRLSYSECCKLDGKKYRKGSNGQIVRDVAYEETVGLQWQLREAIARNDNEGKTDPETGNVLPPNWVPLFSMDEISTIMANPGAKMFIYALTAAIWEVVPELNPMLAAQSQAQLEM